MCVNQLGKSIVLANIIFGTHKNACGKKPLTVSGPDM